jgi:DNA-binding HxlR family transcriptional regulator
MDKIPKQKSLCAISCSLELIGDEWSLIIVRDLFYFGKNTYDDFLKCAEKIDPKTLYESLEKLYFEGIINYREESEGKTYFLTQKGKDLQPILEALIGFGVKHVEGAQEYLEKVSKNIVKLT